MPLPPSPALLHLSLNADATVPGGRSLRGDVETVVRLLADHDLAAMWSSRTPLDMPFAGDIVRHARQELALDLRSGGKHPGRQDQIAELRRQVLRAQAAGVSLSTVIAADEQLSRDAELLVKYGVTAICPVGESTTRQTKSSSLLRASRWLLSLEAHRAGQPQKVRWGLWRMTNAVHLATEGQWQVRRAVDRAVATSATRCICTSISRRSGRGLEPVQSVVRQVASYAQSGRLVSETMAATAARLSRPRTVVPAGSILRRRAA